MRVSDIIAAIEPRVRSWIQDAVRNIAINPSNPTSGAMEVHELSGGFHEGTLSDTQAPQFLKTDGTRALENDMAVASGKKIDGVDISVLGDNFSTLSSDFAAHDSATAVAAHGDVGAHDHSTTATGGDLTQYAHADGSGTRNAYQAVRLARTITAGDGLTGGGTLTTDLTFNVGSGPGITVGTNAIEVNQAYGFAWAAQHQFNMATAIPPFVLNANARGQTVVGLKADQLNRTLSAGDGLTGGGVLDADRSLAVDLAHDFNWIGAHVWTDPCEFQSPLTTNTLIAGTGQSDIGTPIHFYQTAYIGEIMATVFAENTIQIIGGDFYITKNSGTLPFIVADTDTTVDFGKTMIVGDFVHFKNESQSEFMQVGSLVVDTTYNVTRIGTPHEWPDQSAFAVYGNTGDGFIRLSASDTPQMNVYLQGNDYDDQTEVVRIGNLNAWQGVSSDKYGLALGRYQVGYPNMIFDGDTGTIRIRNFNTDILRFDTTANYLANPLVLDTGGGIFQGSGTFASPTRGLKMSNSGGYGILEGYNGGVVQAAFNSSGEITWLGGEGVLNASGATIGVDSSFNTSRGFRLKTSGGTVFGGLFGISGVGPDIRTVQVYSEAGAGQFARSELRAFNTSGSFEGLIRNTASDSGSTVLVSATNIILSPDTLTTLQGPAASLVPTTLNLGTATTTALTIGRSGIVANVAGPLVHTNVASSVPSFSGDGIYMLAGTSNRGLDGLYNRVSGTSHQLSIPHVTAFPSSPPTGRTVFRTDFRSLWIYDGSAWRQASVGEFSGSFPSSPQDKMRVLRSDRDIEYFWNNSTSQWLSTETITATVGDVRTLATTGYPNSLTSATVVMTWHVNTTTYAVRVVESEFESGLGATNSGSHYWTYTVAYAHNAGGGAATLVTGNTSLLSANATTKHALTDTTLAQSSTSGRIALTLQATGVPTNLTFRGIIKYRYVG